MTATERVVHERDEIDDAALVAIVRKGIFGVPAVYAIALVLSLPGAGWPTAPLIAILPALFAGPWLGMTIGLMTRPSAPAVVHPPDDAVSGEGRPLLPAA